MNSEPFDTLSGLRAARRELRRGHRMGRRPKADAYSLQFLSPAGKWFTHSHGYDAAEDRMILAEYHLSTGATPQRFRLTVKD